SCACTRSARSFPSRASPWWDRCPRISRRSRPIRAASPSVATPRMLRARCSPSSPVRTFGPSSGRRVWTTRSRRMGQFGIGQPVTRFEDPRLLRGRGNFINDVNLPNQAYAYLLRSPHAHARIVSLDTTAASAAPSVLAVFTGTDVARDNLGTMTMTLKRKRPDGSPMFARPHTGLTRDRVRYVGDPVALIVAETMAAARDAADLVEIEYTPLPSVTSTADAGAPGTAPVWEECPDNISNVFESGDRAATDAAFARAAHVVRSRYVISRVHAQFMETRGAIGQWDPGEERYTLYADVQYPHRVRQALASNIFKVPEN